MFLEFWYSLALCSKIAWFRIANPSRKLEILQARPVQGMNCRQDHNWLMAGLNLRLHASQLQVSRTEYCLLCLWQRILFGLNPPFSDVDSLSINNLFKLSVRSWRADLQLTMGSNSMRYLVRYSFGSRLRLHFWIFSFHLVCRLLQ